MTRGFAVASVVGELADGDADSGCNACPSANDASETTTTPGTTTARRRINKEACRCATDRTDWRSDPRPDRAGCEKRATYPRNQAWSR